MKAKLPDLSFTVYETFHRVFVRFQQENREAISGALSRTFGVVSFDETLRVGLDMAEIEAAACTLAEGFIR